MLKFWLDTQKAQVFLFWEWRFLLLIVFCHFSFVETSFPLDLVSLWQETNLNDSLQKWGISLPDPAFLHWILCIAFSVSTSKCYVWVLIKNAKKWEKISGKNRDFTEKKKIVFHEMLLWDCNVLLQVCLNLQLFFVWL